MDTSFMRKTTALERLANLDVGHFTNHGQSVARSPDEEAVYRCSPPASDLIRRSSVAADVRSSFESSVMAGARRRHTSASAF